MTSSWFVLAFPSLILNKSMPTEFIKLFYSAMKKVFFIEKLEKLLSWPYIYTQATILPF